MKQSHRITFLQTKSDKQMLIKLSKDTRQTISQLVRHAISQTYDSDKLLTLDKKLLSCKP